MKRNAGLFFVVADEKDELFGTKPDFVTRTQFRWAVNFGSVQQSSVFRRDVVEFARTISVHHDGTVTA